MTTYHLKHKFNGINDEMLIAVDAIADGSVARDGHNFWFESNVDISVINALCDEYNLQIILF